MTDRMEHEMADLDPAATIYMMDLEEVTPHVAVYHHRPPMREDKGRTATIPRDDYDRLGKPTLVYVRVTTKPQL